MHKTSVITADLSFILVKPDCLGDANALAAVYEMVEASKMAIVREFELMIDEAGLRCMWGLNYRRIISRSFLSLYLKGKIVRILLLKGEDLLRKVSVIKKAIRKQYSQGMFANRVHAPSDPEENETQLRFLLGGGNDASVTEDPGFTTENVTFTRVNDYGFQEIFEIAEKVWHESMDDGKVTHCIPARFADTTGVVLYDDDRNPFDYFVSAVCKVKQDIALETAILTVLEMNRFGSVRIGFGSERRAGEAEAEFSDLGLRCKTIPLDRLPGKDIAIVLLGPGGSGKTTLAKWLEERMEFEKCVMCSTRSPRPGERDGTDYRFVGSTEFESLFKNGELITRTVINGNAYGIPSESLRKKAVVVTDMYTLRQLKQASSSIISIYVDAPREERMRRMLQRGDAPQDIERKMAMNDQLNAAERQCCDHTVNNYILEDAFQEIRSIISKNH